MIKTFLELKKQYESKEVTMDELKMLHATGVASFANQGISRSNRDCLQCVITFDKLHELIAGITSRTFLSAGVLSTFIEASALGLIPEPEAECITFRDADGSVEIIGTIGSDARVTVDSGDVEAMTSFQVFLRVQH
ncbi:hypothetical protein [Sulfurimonas sp. HSL3-7]|uniref:hypothetical protein n=1 Tax=Sulfonitrofixus jiaomeiensis TaxID=3131938 RepID=UPI0031FA1E20